ncbi:Predicted O-methyltransferase YrrM [Mesonia phycicola]|uniref:Predicted O-methyltransferase YrrM n=1 Tax=Mesonia phycicola TaxID=579105 RepID=A0A1M6ANV2_9FLAO|nr:class I SAM-dependent methyltransferase [Mesonia phycicola]SHI38077.1 Predicted O-methyltransferase YrrM [Mesonia phycicola]
MWFQLKSYLKFLVSSRNQHGVHSPFVYSLVTKCFYDRKNKNAYQKISAYRKDIFQQKKEINVTDFGAGSRVFKSNKRKVAAIAKNAGISWKRSKLLYRLSTYLEYSNVLELGTSVGLATASLAANKKLNVFTIEGCPQTAHIATQTLQKHQLYNAKVTVGKFEEILKNYSHKIDLAYIDGNHSKEATLKNFELLLKLKHNDSLFIFDDIYWSEEMLQAWEEIKNHPEVTVTIDTFYWGLVFFRKEQAKEHFKIRS